MHLKDPLINYWQIKFERAGEQVSHEASFCITAVDKIKQ